MLSPDEVGELALHFRFVGTPLLIREIIADLRKEPSPNRVPREVVRALAAKMGKAHGVQPADFRSLAISNLLAHPVPMSGQVPVDTRAPNVAVVDSGKGLLYDSTPEQRLWSRWAAGDFETGDDAAARAWRDGLQKVNLRAVGDEWKHFAHRHFGTSRNLGDLISQVEAMISTGRRETQAELLNTSLALLRVSPLVRKVVDIFFETDVFRNINSWAPYTSAVLKLYLTFVGGLARGFIGPRPSHVVDLQYLFYAPFCMVFVSGDKFHREMWRATSGRNTFVWGPELKQELRALVANRMEKREQGSPGEPDKDFHSENAANSIIGSAWNTYMTPRDERNQPGSTRTFDELDPETKRDFEIAFREFDRMDRLGRGHAKD